MGISRVAIRLLSTRRCENAFNKMASQLGQFTYLANWHKAKRKGDQSFYVKASATGGSSLHLATEKDVAVVVYGQSNMFR